MSKTEAFDTCKIKDDNIEAAYLLKECLDYVEVGSFHKDLDRVMKSLTKNPTFSNDRRNPKLGTLIGKKMFFETLSNLKVINAVEDLKKIFLGVSIKDGNVYSFSFDKFYCVKDGKKVTLTLQ